MRFGSVCSGIEAASAAWMPLGWEAAWLSEIEPFPCAVLAHHYPDVPNLGDMTTLPERIASGEVEAPDVFTGGTPCQAFSVAGKRGSLSDDRGNLSLTFCEIANAIDDVRAAAGREPCIVVWENVPGVLSTSDNAFGCFLGALAGSGCELQPAGGRWTNAGLVLGPRRAVAWRILDAQYFGLAQRRRRVFVVASARDGFDPAAVLFEFDGVRRDSPPSREARQVAPTIPSRSTAGGGLGTDFDLDGGVITMAHGQGGAEIGFNRGPTLTCNHEAPIVAHSLRGEGFDVSARPRKAKDGEPRAFLDAHVDYQGDGCVIWPFGRFKSGYGSVGRNERAHRLMCELAHGPAPDGYDAAHSCGRRLCINPLHLRWATRADNMADAIAHGTTTRGEKHGAARLTEVAALDILARLMAGETHDAIAAAHGVARTTVTDIAKGKNWAWLSAQDGTGRGTPLVSCVVSTLTSNGDAHSGFRDAEGLVPVAFAIQAGALRTNPASGPDGVGVQADHAYTLEARAEVQAVAFDTTQITSAANYSSPKPGDPCHPLAAGAHQPAVTHAIRTAQTGSNGWGVDPDTAYTLDQAQGQAVQAGMAVRRLTPRECEALQGFKADYTRIPWRNKPASDCPDGPRYKALGNSWAVPCAAWIGARIAKVVA